MLNFYGKLMEYREEKLSEQLTMEQVEFWLGSDMAQTEMIEILTELANGSYTQQNFKQDIKDTWESNHV